jgi:hypothetical protein
MTSKTKCLIDLIIEKRSNGNPLLAEMTKTKMILKGIDPTKFTSSTPDDPKIIEKLEKLASELGIKL